jgi:cystathionine beta-lyase/cystathionine gamma-synthase
VPTQPESEVELRARQNTATTRPVLRCLTAEPALPRQRGSATREHDEAIAESAADLLVQLASCDVRLRAAGRAVREHARYCERAMLPVDQPVIARLLDAVEHARARVAQERALLFAHGTDDRPQLLSGGELVVRFALSTHAYVRDALEWCAPASAQAHAVQFFDLAAQHSPVPADARHGDASVREVERQTAELLGLSGTHTVSATSSGHAAYTLVESVLLRERLRPGDIVLTAPTLHHDAVDQLTTLPFVRTLPVEGHTVDALLSAVVRYRPRCLFLAPIGGTARQRMVDVDTVVRRLASLATPITVVIDGTATSGALPGELFADASTRGVEVIYYENASAYLQQGLDTAMAGIVAHPVALRGAFTRQRAATGTILHRHAADLFPRYTTDLHRRRLRRIERNTEQLATMLAEDAAVADHGVVCHPSLPGHPDVHLAHTSRHAGGCVTFWFHDPVRNRHADLDSVCTHILANARVLGVQLTTGAGFGFAVPRLCVMTSRGGTDPVSDDDPGYLRLSVGDRKGQLDLLAEVVAAALSDPIARALTG